MTYKETLEYLYTQLPMYQREGKKAYKQDLTNTIALLSALGNPQDKFKSVHIAGTNGKGSSAHAIAAIMQSAGYKTGLYTSPHLKNFTERIRINGVEVEETFVVDFVNRIKDSIQTITPSFFEITVAMAFDYFASQEVDIAIIETGLGGRLDSTNVITPEVCLITNIGYDHMDLLGNTLTEIASEKAGIMKKGVPVVVGEWNDETKSVFDKKAEEIGALLSYAADAYWDSDSKYLPKYFMKNYPGIAAIIEQLRKQGWRVNEEQFDDGLKRRNELTGLKGRFQVLKEEPLLIADVSHNLDGLTILLEQVRSLNKGQLYLIFGTVKDKDLAPIFKLLPNANLYWTQSSVPRALSVQELAIQGVMNGLEGECYTDVNEAIRVVKEKAQPEDTILVTGSTFVVAEINEL